MLLSPIILGALVVVVGLFANILAYNFVESAMSAILREIMEPGQHLNVKISHWHGFNIELWMTIGVIILVGLLFFTMKKWSQSAFYRGEQDIFNNGYDWGYEGLIKSSQFITGMQLTGRLRDYFVYMCTFILLIIGYTMYR